MSGVNKVMLVGRLGTDPETKTSASGVIVSKLSLATNRRKRVNDGYEEVTDWHRVAMFGNQAELVQKYCRTGDLIGVEGEIQYDQWTTESGEKRRTTNIVGQRVHFLGKKAQARTEGPIAPVPPLDDGSEIQAEDTLPF